MISGSRLFLLPALLALATSAMYGQGERSPYVESVRETAPRWAPIGPNGGNIAAAAFHPADPSVVLCGTGGGGIFRSTTRGGSWGAVGEDAIYPFIQCITFSTSNPSFVYAGTGMGLHKSSDGGESWTAAGGALALMQVVAIAVHPNRPLTVYAGTSSHGIFKSLNGGKSWSWLEHTLGYGHVRQLVIDRSNPKVMYAGVTGIEPSGVFKSVDAGDTWSHVGLANNTVMDLVLSPHSSNTLIVACGSQSYRTTDGGASWGEFGKGIPPVSTVAMDTQNADVAYAGTDMGVYKTSDSGTTWTAVLKRPWVFTVELSPSDPSTVCAGTAGDGVYLSTDGGARWATTNKGLCARQVRALAFDAKSAGVFYACGMNWAGRGMQAGSGWKAFALPSLLSPPEVNGIAVHPEDSKIVYLAVGWHGVYKTTDGCATWETSGPRRCNMGPLLIHPDRPDTVLVGTCEKGIMRSRDGGRVWVPAGLKKAGEITSFAPDPTSPGRLFVGTAEGIWKGTVDGSTWSRAGLADYAINCLASSPKGVLYAGTGHGGVFRSDDGGGSWRVMNTGLSSGVCASAIAIDPKNESNLCVALVQSGVYRSEDGAATWTPMNEGMPSMIGIPVLMFDPKDPGTLYAGTEGGGVYKIKP
ncbi:MAG: hypothetical protein AB1714_10715 [Acidobacteriota bacterium]